MRSTVALWVFLAGCATAPPLLRMEPSLASGQDIQFKNGTPIVTSRGERFDVVVSPRGGPTGRYRLEPRIPIMVGVRSRDDHRVEVSEASITAMGDDFPARVVTAAEIEDSVLANAALAQNLNAVAGVLRALAASTAGKTTFTATASSGTVVGGQVYDSGAALQAQRVAAQEAAATSAAIDARATAALTQVATVFQRNSIEPGETYVGVTFIEPRVGPCRLRMRVAVDGEVHSFEFNEIADPTSN